MSKLHIQSWWLQFHAYTTRKFVEGMRMRGSLKLTTDLKTAVINIEPAQ